MATLLTDVHTHSTFSPDGVSPLEEMLKTALEQGVAFYGVSEHVNYDMLVAEEDGRVYATERHTDVEDYFHTARHLQEDYAGAMNVLVGAEFGYADDARVSAMYKALIEKYRPDFIVNSIHTIDGVDYWCGSTFYKEEKGERVERDKAETYKEYLALLLRSVQADYDYDIVGHIGYPTRYAPYADKSMPYKEYAQEIDAVLREIIARGKILEVNASGDSPLPNRDVLERYYALGGREISYASDAHATTRIMKGRDKVIDMLKEIGFTYITVPCKGEKIKVEI
ncbi:MAG: histidinol-phosphatase HisJ family protein [Clostridia bacterium]|nr:histidinol-phosphatase HisJ family protein [Clostridia bacterium]